MRPGLLNLCLPGLAQEAKRPIAVVTLGDGAWRGQGWGRPVGLAVRVGT